MRNEYGLQVLFNALADKESTKYAKVRELKLYSELYESWFKLLELLKIPIEPKNNEILHNYYKTVDEMIHKLILADRASRGYDDKSLLSLFSPPTTTILV
eukprot:TRINITY_DN21214_c0_g1_i1.p1 TRINITY_DN21214_c0_g1~~TRINITY_DN21214_c0_g1_i1.p1  ORF type:complete len:100 (+),score=36.62 TRINITY_DN21214_c0_g1_i1:112-411(+)